MAVSIRIYGKEAQFSAGTWRCDDDGVLAMLEALADPRARTPEAEQAHAQYCAGRFGGAVWNGQEWQGAQLPEPELTLGDFAPGRPEKAGWLSWMKRRRSS